VLTPRGRRVGGAVVEEPAWTLEDPDVAGPPIPRYSPADAAEGDAQSAAWLRLMALSCAAVGLVSGTRGTSSGAWFR
jgi:hypothetical protein